MKQITVILIMFFCIFSQVYAEETDEQNIIEEYVSIYSEDLETAAEESGIYEILPEFDTREILLKSASGDNLFNLKDLFNRLLEILFGEIQSVLKIMLYITALSLLSSYLSALSESTNKDVSDIAFYACYIIIAGISAATFLEIMACAQGAIDNILIVARMIIPVVITSLAATGAISSAAVFQPMLLAVIEIALVIIEKIFIPILMLFTALNIVNCISSKINGEKMVQFLGKTVKWGLSVLLTVFVGTAGLQSLASGCADGLSVKLTKYAASNLIPVVGGILSETVETVMNCSVIIKNAVGIIGIIVLLGTMLLPIIKISACLIVLRITAALIQPISDEKIVKCISGIADSVGLVFAVVAAITVMFIIILTIMLNAGNSAVMLGR